ncbi:MAG: zf-HC2 domain-containing protein [Chthonomonadales bacterium]|nr:zf-HC2 domain-containing protein [Chthonomonadales bacterium]
MTAWGACRRARARLWDDAWGRLSNSDEARVREHITRCPACAAEAGRVRSAVDALREVAAEPTPATLDRWADVRRRLTATPAPLAPARSPLRAAAASALCSAAVTAALALWCARAPLPVPAVRDASAASPELIERALEAPVLTGGSLAGLLGRLEPDVPRKESRPETDPSACRSSRGDRPVT